MVELYPSRAGYPVPTATSLLTALPPTTGASPSEIRASSQRATSLFVIPLINCLVPYRRTSSFTRGAKDLDLLDTCNCVAVVLLRTSSSIAAGRKLDPATYSKPTGAARQRTRKPAEEGSDSTDRHPLPRKATALILCYQTARNRLRYSVALDPYVAFIISQTARFRLNRPLGRCRFPRLGLTSSIDPATSYTPARL